VIVGCVVAACSCTPPLKKIEVTKRRFIIYIVGALTLCSSAKYKLENYVILLSEDASAI
jgi:hypothetical protein